MTAHHRRRRGEPGQILVIMALSVAVLLLGTAVVIDGGNAFVQQRRTQHAADAAAEAGATQLARRMSGVSISDADVLAAINASANSNSLSSVVSAEYTDRDGTILGTVGAGSIPSSTQGVKVVGDLDFNTYIAGLAGQGNWTATADATAITGFATDTGFGAVIPLTFPILMTWCQNGPTKMFFPDDGITVTSPPEDWNPALGTPWPFGPNNVIAIPLCQNGPGNIGWIDWDPPGGGVPDVAADILGGSSPPITTPKWYYATETGRNTALDTPMDFWEGKDIQLPIFHAEADNPATPTINEELIGTCDATPTDDQRDLSDCPTADIGANGIGWYYFDTVAVFHLEHAYIQNNNQAACNDPALASPASPPGSSNPVNNCLIGYFKEKVVGKNLTVGGTTATSRFQPLAIQLID